MGSFFFGFLGELTLYKKTNRVLFHIFRLVMRIFWRSPIGKTIAYSHVVGMDVRRGYPRKITVID